LAPRSAALGGRAGCSKDRPDRFHNSYYNHYSGRRNRAGDGGSAGGTGIATAERHCGKPTEGIWSLLKRAVASFTAADLDCLARIVKRKLKKIQYRPHMINGCLAGTGLTIDRW